MQIAFWSQQPWQSGVVGNMIGIAYMMTELCGGRSLLMQMRFSCPDLDYALFSNCENSQVREGARYFQEVGLDAALNDAILNFSRKERFSNHVLEVKRNCLYYLPGTYKSNREVYEHHLMNHMEQILETAESFGDTVFLDCSGEKGKLYDRFLESADFIIINLSQSPHQIEEVLRLYPDKMDKILYLVGRYDAQSKYHINNIRRKYHIPKEKLLAVPYNVEFQDALCEGRALRFLEQNAQVKKEDLNYELIEEIREAARLILKKAEKTNADRKYIL